VRCPLCREPLATHGDVVSCIHCQTSWPNTGRMPVPLRARPLERTQVTTRTTSAVSAALEQLDAADLRILGVALAKSLGNEPTEAETPLTKVLVAVYEDVVDLEAARVEMRHRQRVEAFTPPTVDPEEIAALEAMFVEGEQ
jgi:hypothetical protein